MWIRNEAGEPVWVFGTGERWYLLAAPLGPGDTVVAIPQNRQIVTISAWQSGSGGTISLASQAGQVVPLPPDGAENLAPGGTMGNGDSVTFGNFPAGGGGYAIELAG